MAELKCKHCQGPLNQTNRPKIFCSHSCGVKWRTKNVYSHKYTVVHRGKSAKNFLKSLCVKKKDRRNLSLDYLLTLYELQKGLCAISGVEMTYICGQGNIDTNISIDRINSALGYEEGNIQLVCRRVNMMKMDKDQEDLKNWCRQILGL